MAEFHPLAALAATWRGAGEGEYPTIAGFAYTEELVITPVPDRPLAHWRSTTRDASTGEPRHAESGFLRATTQGVELVVAHGFGIVEASIGSFDGGVLARAAAGCSARRPRSRSTLSSAVTSSTASACSTRSAMAAVGVPLTHHLRGRTSTGLTTRFRRRTVLTHPSPPHQPLEPFHSSCGLRPPYPIYTAFTFGQRIGNGSAAG